MARSYIFSQFMCRVCQHVMYVDPCNGCCCFGCMRRRPGFSSFLQFFNTLWDGSAPSWLSVALQTLSWGCSCLFPNCLRPFRRSSETRPEPGRERDPHGGVGTRPSVFFNDSVSPTVAQTAAIRQYRWFQEMGRFNLILPEQM